ncbi:hypothetical protein [Gimesia panareensis]|uniref:hypothetical protein n=1 Tax=Gimesia panareensis TaxID=2527978 RepID=UPI00118AB19C|nr:hypothetical protein [Gimesia panareensis]QDU49148.1 hypothetical protein Pan110_14670 [Gimesia panareensis]
MNESTTAETETTETPEPEMRPTYAPAALAMGIMFAFWGILTHWSMSVIGGLMMVGAIWAWMHEIRNTWSETP